MARSANIKLEIGLRTIISYKRLPYWPWYALAEFVDNSTQSFFNHEQVLRNVALANERPLKVVITYDRAAELLSIEDNAMGMSLKELRRALRVATPPLNTKGRSKYGMGLKTAASWLGNSWSIRTKKLGETKEFTVTVNVDKVAKGNARLKLSEKINRSREEHYTVIEIRRHNRKFHTNTLRKIGDYLSSIYREDFRSEVLTLVWQGEILRWNEVNEDLLTDRENRKYKKEFQFTIQGVNEKGERVPKNVSGWVGVLRNGSRAKAGFSELHSGRVIKGWPEAWRPESLFGQIQGSNDVINQRLVGEIRLDDFDVSHTKDDILWLEDEEELVGEQLRIHCGALREVARTYRKRGDDERRPSEVAIRSAVDKLRKELKSSEMATIIGTNPLLPEKLVEEVVEAVKKSVVDKYPETFSAVIEGIAVKGYVDEMSVNDQYLTIDTATPNEVIIIVNSSHPHWSQLKGADGVLNYLRHCTYDGIAEAQVYLTPRTGPRAKVEKRVSYPTRGGSADDQATSTVQFRIQV